MTPSDYADTQSVLWFGRYLDPDLAYLLLSLVTRDNWTEEGVAYFHDEAELVTSTALPPYRARAAYEHLRANGVISEILPFADEECDPGIYLVVRLRALHRLAERGGLPPRTRRSDNGEIVF